MAVRCLSYLRPAVSVAAQKSKRAHPRVFSVDTTTPAGKMVFTVSGAVAKLERSLIVERVKAGLRNARAKGKRLGAVRGSPWMPPGLPVCAIAGCL
jgi:resolvase-like protein